MLLREPATSETRRLPSHEESACGLARAAGCATARCIRAALEAAAAAEHQVAAAASVPPQQA